MKNENHNRFSNFFSLVSYRQNLEQNDQDFSIRDLSRLSGLGVLSSNKGIVTGLGVYVAILMMAMLGTTIAYNTLISERAKKDEWVRAQSFYISQAAAEYAIKKIYAGLSPAVSGKSFAGGSFTITYSNPIATIRSSLGDGNHTLSVSKPSMSDCLLVDASDAIIDNSGDVLHHIHLQKTCLSSVTLDKSKLSWTSATAGEAATAFRYENTYLYKSPSPSVPSGGTMELTDQSISTSSTYEISKLELGGNLNGRTFTLILVMSDGTQTSPVVFTPH